MERMAISPRMERDIDFICLVIHRPDPTTRIPVTQEHFGSPPTKCLPNNARDGHSSSLTGDGAYTLGCDRGLDLVGGTLAAAEDQPG
jgi:hypothetical protein